MQSTASHNGFPGAAACAPAPARSMSSGPQSGTPPSDSNVAGLVISRLALLLASTHSPLMRILCIRHYDAEWAMSATPADTALLVWLTPSMFALFLYGVG